MPAKTQHGCLKDLPLHDHPEWMESCADVLNEEWPRSKTARLHMLEKSNIRLPYCIVLLEQSTSDNWDLIGHSRLCVVHGQPKACFVESVVIKKSKRGQGFGRRLMEITEKHALRLGYNTLYLTTHDKQHFYEHIGYNYCEPVISLGSASNLLSSAMFDRLFGGSSKEAETATEPAGNNELGRSEVVSHATTQNQPGSIQNTTSTQIKCGSPSPGDCTSNTLPPPPPPPPLYKPDKPSHLGPSASLSAKLEPIRMDPNKVFWMKKELNQTKPLI